MKTILERNQYMSKQNVVIYYYKRLFLNNYNKPETLKQTTDNFHISSKELDEILLSFKMLPGNQFNQFVQTAWDEAKSEMYESL